MVPTRSVFKNRDLTVVDGIVDFMYNTLKENNNLKKIEFNSTEVFIMTCCDNLPIELKQMIFKFKRLNHFKQRVQSLSVLLQNQKANQHDDIVNLFINKSRGSNERVLRWLSSKCISITSQFVQVIYLRHLSKLAVVIESHELRNESYQSVITDGWKNNLLQLKLTANNFDAKSLYKSFQ
jgi:spore maturation protein CgeB